MASDNDNREQLPTPTAFSDLVTAMAEAFGAMALANLTGDKAGVQQRAAEYQERRVRLCKLYARALAGE